MPHALRASVMKRHDQRSSPIQGYLCGRGRVTEASLELPAELRRAVVADQVSRLVGLLALPDKRVGPVQLHRFGVLPQRDSHHRLEVLVSAGHAQADHARAPVRQQTLDEPRNSLASQAGELQDLVQYSVQRFQ